MVNQFFFGGEVVSMENVNLLWVVIKSCGKRFFFCCFPRRQVSDDVGVAEALLSKSSKRVPIYVENDKPVWSLCERRVHKGLISNPAKYKHRHSRITTAYREITEKNAVGYPLQDHEAARSAKTLVFLCARKSGLSSKVAADHFELL